MFSFLTTVSGDKKNIFEEATVFCSLNVDVDEACNLNVDQKNS